MWEEIWRGIHLNTIVEPLNWEKTLRVLYLNDTIASGSYIRHGWLKHCWGQSNILDPQLVFSCSSQKSFRCDLWEANPHQSYLCLLLNIVKPTAAADEMRWDFTRTKNLTAQKKPPVEAKHTASKYWKYRFSFAKKRKRKNVVGTQRVSFLLTCGLAFLNVESKNISHSVIFPLLCLRRDLSWP